MNDDKTESMRRDNTSWYMEIHARIYEDSSFICKSSSLLQYFPCREITSSYWKLQTYDSI